MAQEKWEYMTEFVWADVTGIGVREYLQKRWPDFKPAKNSPETMIPVLNNRGEAGWELVSIQPIQIENDCAVVIPTAHRTQIYFCAYKRRISE